MIIFPINNAKPQLVMNSTRMTKAIFRGLLATIVIVLTNCTSASGPEPEWAKKNKDLIKQYNLTERELPGLPESKVASNLEPAKVTGVDSLASALLHAGVNAKLFWGSGIMVATLKLEPNAKIPEEVLPADRFVFVLEGTVEQSIDGSPVTMTGQQREP